LKKQSFLIKTLLILLLTSGIVASFGIIPLPEYSTDTNQKLDGEVFYLVEIQSSNILPPAPDIVDQCIYKIKISTAIIDEEKVICTSDLYQYSYDIYLNDIEMDTNQNLVLRYWDNPSNSEMTLVINTKNSEIKKLNNKDVSIVRSNYEVNFLGERLLSSWDMREMSPRSAGIYYQKNSNIIEVFNVEAPTNYYFESLRWSPDGNSIVALDTENSIIIFSKNKIHEPIKLNLVSSYSPQFEGDEKIIYQVIGWSN
jgi:hypothetical protein